MSLIEQMSLCYDWASFGYMAQSGELGHEVDWFPIFWETIILIPKQLCQFALPPAMEECAPLTPYPLQHKLFSVFLILVILTGVRWYLRVILICVSLVTKDGSTTDAEEACHISNLVVCSSA